MAAKDLRFYLDENMPVEIAKQLKSRGIDVVTARELGALGDSDEKHLRRAAEMGRVYAPTIAITFNWRWQASNMPELCSASRIFITSARGSIISNSCTPFIHRKICRMFWSIYNYGKKQS